MIDHHLPDDLILEYAAGAASPPDALVVACHLVLCPVCRARVAAAEAAGGALLHDAPPGEVSAHVRAATLARLDEAVPPAPPLTGDPDGILPAPLAAHVGAFSALRWRWRFPGVHEVPVPVTHEGMPARLFQLADGGVVPPHQHVGRETTLVLTGGFTDDSGHYTRGDVCARDEEGVHRQVIDRGEPCVVLVAADGPFLPRSLYAWIASVTRGF